MNQLCADLLGLIARRNTNVYGTLVQIFPKLGNEIRRKMLLKSCTIVNRVGCETCYYVIADSHCVKHREDGPTITRRYPNIYKCRCKDGYMKEQKWMINGKIHRDNNKPAIILSQYCMGNLQVYEKQWYINGIPHYIAEYKFRCGSAKKTGLVKMKTFVFFIAMECKSLLPDAELYYIPDFLSPEEQEILLADLIQLPFKRHKLYYYRPDGSESIGRQNRESAWIGEHAQSVQDAKRDQQRVDYVMPNNWSPVTFALKQRIEEVANTQFNSCLVGMYYNGQDKIGWHSDNSDAMGQDPIIASLSLGSSRIFNIKRKRKNRSGAEKLLINLEPGSLLLMKRGVNAGYLHSVPATGSDKQRINMTFRNYKYSEDEMKYTPN